MPTSSSFYRMAVKRNLIKTVVSNSYGVCCLLTDNSFSSELLDGIKLWVTIKGLSAWMEGYKQTTKTHAHTHKSQKKRLV